MPDPILWRTLGGVGLSLANHQRFGVGGGVELSLSQTALFADSSGTFQHQVSIDLDGGYHTVSKSTRHGGGSVTCGTVEARLSYTRFIDAFIGGGRMGVGPYISYRPGPTGGRGIGVAFTALAPRNVNDDNLPDFGIRLGMQDIVHGQITAGLWVRAPLASY